MVERIMVTPEPLPAMLPGMEYFDYLGIGVFAVSGALLAAQKRQTFVTFLFLAVATGIGGGTVRDLLLGASVFGFIRTGSCSSAWRRP